MIKSIKKLRQEGEGNAGRIFWEARSDEPIGYNEARDAQGKQGYSYMGYFFDKFQVEYTPSGECVATWTCQAGCD